QCPAAVFTLVEDRRRGATVVQAFQGDIRQDVRLECELPDEPGDLLPVAAGFIVAVEQRQRAPVEIEDELVSRRFGHACSSRWSRRSAAAGAARRVFDRFLVESGRLRQSYRWQATSVLPPWGCSTGVSTRQRSKANGQRLANRHPGLMSTGVGTSPPISSGSPVLASSPTGSVFDSSARE